jgi:hypothetical protein
MISEETYELMKELIAEYDWNRIKQEIDEKQPYIEIHKVVLFYNPEYGDNRECECGYPHYRHFDTYENMETVGCKYCKCFYFKEKLDLVKVRKDKIQKILKNRIMKNLLKELEERLSYLKTLEETPTNNGKISELQLVIVRVQQIVLSNLNTLKDMTKDVEVQEVEIKDGLKLAIMIYKGSGDPVFYINKAIKLYMNGSKEYFDFIDANMDNPWVRIIVKGKLY